MQSGFALHRGKKSRCFIELEGFCSLGNTCAAVKRQSRGSMKLLYKELGEGDFLIYAQRLISTFPVEHQILIRVGVWKTRIHVRKSPGSMRGAKNNTNFNPQLSSSKEQVWESSGKRLKSMLQAAVTVTLG